MNLKTTKKFHLAKSNCDNHKSWSQLYDAISDDIKCILSTINNVNSIAVPQHKNAAIVNLEEGTLMQRKLKTTMAEIENGSMISIFSIKSKCFSNTTIQGLSLSKYVR